ncbi:MAG TPA: patatin-like phospholipase family protein [Candidatus Methylomirabilis sp.]|nr:patatin-like phospholipase family protein [Candidatus Methylomirabilis sp.]
MADADLVLEGGGVKGTGLVGAITALTSAEEPYTFHRVAGTSAGAIVASMLAAGYTAAEMNTVMTDLDFTQFEDNPGLFARHFEQVGEGLGLALHEGLFMGRFLHDWIKQILAAKNVRTWGDLKDDDPGSSLPPEERYKLVVIVSDVSRGRMLRLPWDYQPLLGVDPDAQPVADAVRSSAGIPFFFRPFPMTANPQVTGAHSEILCTDGGMLSNFPVSIFDRTDGKPPRWPTFGIKLSARQTPAQGTWNPDADAIQLAKSLLTTMQKAHDQVYVDQASVASRTIFVDTTGYNATDFHLLLADKQKLFNNGLAAGQKFLGKWDWPKWQQGDYTTLA